MNPFMWLVEVDYESWEVATVQISLVFVIVSDLSTQRCQAMPPNLNVNTYREVCFWICSVLHHVLSWTRFQDSIGKTRATYQHQITFWVCLVTSRGLFVRTRKVRRHTPCCLHCSHAAFLNVGSSWNGSIITKTTPASSTSLLVGISSSYANYSINPTNRLYSSCCWLEESLVIAILSDL